MRKRIEALCVACLSISSLLLGLVTLLSGDSEATSWNVQRVDSAGILGSASSIALDRSGYPHFSYLDGGSNDLKHANWTGATWNLETVDSAGAVGLYSTSIAIDGSNNPHISYYNASGSSLKYAKWNGSAWVTQNVVGVGFDFLGWSTSIALNSSDNPRISYYDAGANVLGYAVWNGSVWATQAVDTAGSVGKWNSLALDSMGFPHISYYDATSGSLKYARWDGSSWIVVTVDDAGDVGQYSSVVLDVDDYVHISYYDVTNTSLKYAEWSGSAWNIVTVDTLGDVGRYSSLALDYNGYARICYRDEGNRDLKYAQWTGSAWSIEVVDGGLDVGSYGSIELDGSGYVHMSYADSSSFDLMYAKGKPNQPPMSPALPSGPTSVEVSALYSYSTSGTDPDGDQVKYTFDWCDSTTSETGFVNSGVSAGQTHSWMAAGTYYVRAKTTDIGGATSPWSSSLLVKVASVPGAPTSLVALPDLGLINLSWNAPTDDGGSPITNYSVYRGTSSGGETFLAEIGNVLAYSDSSVTLFTTYFYQVAAKNAAGQGLMSSEANATPLSWPGPPENLGAVGGAMNVTVTWSPPLYDGGMPITNYTVYRGANGLPESFCADLGNVVVFVDTNVTSNIYYTYSVGARNAIGEGPYSGSNGVWPIFPPSPAQITDVAAGDRQVTLTWLQPFEDNHGPVTSYTIYRGPTSGSEFPITTVPFTGTTETYTDTGLTNGMTYYYYVTARNLGGEGPPSNEVSATPAIVPDPPQGLLATPGDSLVMLVWLAPSNDGGAPVTNYTIYRGNTLGGETFLREVGPVLVHTDTGLTNGVTYYYVVRAKNAMGEGQPSIEAGATPATTPGPPVGLNAVVGTGQVTLTWSAPVSDGGSPVTNFRIHRGSVSGGATFLIELGNVLTYVDSTVSSGATYYYTVRAKNSLGEGPDSNEAAASLATAPGPPVNLVASAGNARVILTWSAPASDGGSAVTNYTVYRGTAPGSETFLVEITNVLTCTDSMVTNGLSYYYEVHAKNAIGEGLESNEVSATPGTTPPEPLNLQAVAGDGQVALTWAAPATDGGSPITNYRIYRGMTSGSEVFLSEVGNVLAFTDTGAANGQTYYYTVRAVNSVGEGSPSEEVLAAPTSSPPSTREKSILEEMWFWVLVTLAIVVVIVVAALLTKKRKSTEIQITESGVTHQEKKDGRKKD